MSNKTNVAAEIREQIRALTGKRLAEIAEIKSKRAEAYQQKETAENDLKVATKETNLEAYETAKLASRKAQIAIDMYTARLNQLNLQDFVTEEESTETINKLLEYEKELDDSFKKAIVPHLKALHELQEEYQRNIDNTEFVLKEWTNSIRKNYISSTATYPDGTNRSPVPVPVHQIQYTGCNESARLRSYLKTEKERGLQV
jgi:hypothetical protein